MVAHRCHASVMPHECSLPCQADYIKGGAHQAFSIFHFALFLDKARGYRRRRYPRRTHVCPLLHAAFDVACSEHADAALRKAACCQAGQVLPAGKQS